MKKRILAFALTLAMVVTSLSMLSFVSFAEDAPADDRPDVYAYQGTLNIDGALGLGEPFIVENSNNILPNVTMALSWDYDYIYVLMYHFPSNAQTNCFKTATVTIGGATATVNVDESTISGCDGAKVFTNYYAIEMAIPLSAVTLDEVALANGIALVKFDMTLNSIEDGEEATNTFAYDAILSGRSLISRIVDLNNNTGSKETNGYRGFNGASGFYNVTTGADVADKTGMTNQVFTPDRTNWNLVDASGVDGLVRIYSLFSGINEFVATSNGTGSHFDFQLNVTNLPAGTIDTSKVGAGIGVNANSNNAPVISFFAGGKGGAGLGGDTRGAHLYNDVNNGLSLVYTTKENGADVTKTVDLGVEMGELFKLGFTQNLDGTIDILINEAKIAEAYEYGFSLTGSQGAFWFQSMRGKTGLGDSGYSLDLNKNETIDDNEKIAFQMTNFVVCALNEVDVATVASITKNNATPSSTMIFAGSKYADGSKVNVASMAKAYATYDLDEGMVYLNVSNVNIDAIKLNVGGLDANVTYSSGYGAAIVDSTSDKVTATIDANKAWTTIALPIDKLVVYKDNLGNAVIDITIDVIREDQLVTKENEKRTKSTTVASFEGTIVLCNELLLTSNVIDYNIYQSKGATEPAVGSLSIDSTLNNTAGRFAFCTAESLVYWIKRTARVATFDFEGTSMTAYPVSEIAPDGWGYSTTGDNSPQDRVAIFLSGYMSSDDTTANIYTKGSIKLVFVNAYETNPEDAYIYISFQDLSGQHYVVSTGKKVNEAFTVRIKWNVGNSGTVFVDDTAILSVDTILSGDSGVTGGSIFDGMSGHDKSMFMVEAYRMDTSNETSLKVDISNFTVFEYAQSAIVAPTKAYNAKYMFTPGMVDTGATQTAVTKGGTTAKYVTIDDSLSGDNRIYVMQTEGNLASIFNREFTMDLTVNKLAGADFTKTTFTKTSNPATAHSGYEVLHFHANAIDSTNGQLAGSIIFSIVNDVNRGILLMHNSKESGAIEIVLGKELGEAIDLRVIWFANNHGAVYVDNVLVYETTEIRANSSVKINSDGTWPSNAAFSGSNAKGMVTFNFMRDSSISNSSYIGNANIIVNNVTTFKLEDRFSMPVDSDYVVGLSAANKVSSDTKTIKLSYVQETYSATTVTGASLTNDPIAGGGGTRGANDASLSVNNTDARAYAQGGFAPLGVYGNRSIDLTLNVQNLNEYDFSNGGALLDAEKYSKNILATYGTTGTGIGAGNNDLSVDAYDKLLIGAVAKASADGKTYAAMVFYVVNDSNDGLVLVHTDCEGNQTVIVLGKEMMNKDIDISIEWNIDNTGSVKIGSNEAIVLAECRTVHVTFTHGSGDNTTQCYFSGYAACKNGYIGLNSVWSSGNSAENYVAPAASITSFKATSGHPFNVRFIATIDTLDAKAAGFEINIEGSSKVKTMTTTTVYEAITANCGRDRIEAPDGKYFLALDLQNVPTNASYTFVVKPFFTYAGHTTYGTAYEITYTNGVYSGYAVAN